MPVFIVQFQKPSRHIFCFVLLSSFTKVFTFRNTVHVPLENCSSWTSLMKSLKFLFFVVWQLYAWKTFDDLKISYDVRMVLWEEEVERWFPFRHSTCIAGGPFTSFGLFIRPIYQKPSVPNNRAKAKIAITLLFPHIAISMLVIFNICFFFLYWVLRAK